MLLHCCCAPCSSYVLEYLSEYFKITAFFYNPNITDRLEYEKRKAELIRYIGERHFKYDVDFADGDYSPQLFWNIAKGKEDIPEGGERCFSCYRLRLEKTAALAKAGNYDFFCTTLSVSPHKNAQMLNLIGGELEKTAGVPYLFSDFKKRNGYKRSIELSAQYGLYRQNYCGCVFSKNSRETMNFKKISEKS